MADAPIFKARALRRRMSLPETLLWVRIRRSEFHFRCQHPVPPYPLDFYCEAARLAVEVDGSYHEGTVERDIARDNYLLARDIRTRRIPAEDILRDAEGVAEFVLALARELRDGP